MVKSLGFRVAAFIKRVSHAAIREDISANLLALEDPQQKFHPDMLLLESGGDNLAAHFSRELADYTIYVIDVAGGEAQWQAIVNVIQTEHSRKRGFLLGLGLIEAGKSPSGPSFAARAQERWQKQIL